MDIVINVFQLNRLNITLFFIPETPNVCVDHTKFLLGNDNVWTKKCMNRKNTQEVMPMNYNRNKCLFDSIHSHVPRTHGHANNLGNNPETSITIHYNCGIRT